MGRTDERSPCQLGGSKVTAASLPLDGPAPAKASVWAWSQPLRLHRDQQYIVLAWVVGRDDVGLYLGQGTCPVSEGLDLRLEREVRKPEYGDAEVLATEYVARYLAVLHKVERYYDAYVFTSDKKARAFCNFVKASATPMLLRALGTYPQDTWATEALKHGWRPPRRVHR
jgi:hypothetical protein